MVQSPNKNVNVLVTGGAGYIGSILVPRLLDEGFSVTVVDNLFYNQNSLLECCANNNFNFIKGDICDHALIQNQLKSCDVIIPLAALVGGPLCDANRHLAHLVNDDAHENMVRNISADQKVIFPNTNSGYGVGNSGELCDEKSPLRPISEYARTKVKIEQSFLDRGNAVTFRLATVFGMSPRMRIDLLVNDFVYRAVKDRFVILFEEKFKRNFIHVRDVTEAFLFGIENYEQMRGEPYNVGLSSANLTKLELCQEIQRRIPEFVVEIAKIGEDPDKRDYLVSNDKLESLGWAARYTLQDGIEELIKGYSIVRPHVFSNF